MVIACALWMHHDGLFGGPAFYEDDTRVFYYPLAHWVSEQLKTGTYPLWLPGIFTGYPIFADGEMGLLYAPQVALLAWLRPDIALVWLRVLHVALAGAFMHLFLRTLRLGPLPSLAGALVFALGSFLTGQMHHENVVRSAVWLPLVLALAERALRSGTRRRRWAWVAVAALAFAMSALGLHVQPVLMLALTLGAWGLFRALLGPLPDPWALRPRLVALLEVAGGTVVGGLGLAFAQWLPLAEWARVSYRGGGVDYEFASAFELSLQNLPTLLFPYFFRSPDAAHWWSLWHPWETELYLGVPTLALALVGVLFSRRREALFFLLVGAGALLVGLAQNAPLFNIHQVLWNVPGFSFLRAPARFTYLVVFAGGGLAALGLQALVDAQPRRWPVRAGLALAGALPPVVVLAALLALFPAWHTWLAADPARGHSFAADWYFSARSQRYIAPDEVYQGLLASLDLTNVKTAWSLALLGLTAAGFVAWLELGQHRLRVLAPGLFVSLLAVDLLVFAGDFHPRAPLASLAPAAPPGVPPDARVLVRADTSLSEYAPDSLLASGTATVEGYSSLPSERHLDVYARTSEQPALLDAWSAGYVLEPRTPADGHEAAGVPFRLEHPLVGGYQGSGATTFIAPAGLGPVGAVRLVGTLSYAFDVPQGTVVGQVTVSNQQGAVSTLPIRAGVELAERAIDRPALAPLLRHQKPSGPTAYDFEEYAPDGTPYPAHLYLADLPLPSAQEVATLAVTPLHPKALLQIHGLGLVGADGSVRPLSLADREGMSVVGETADAFVLHDETTHPRAFVVDRGATVDRATQPDRTPAEIMTGPGFDPRANVLLEGAPPSERSETPASLTPVAVEDLGPNAVRISAHADGPSYLVVDDYYHRGWTATVDGHSAPVYIANAMFRAVPLDPGDHTIEMRYTPITHLIGAAGSLLSLLVAAIVMARGFGPRFSLRRR